MTTYAELKTAVARDLRDPSAKTFSTDDIVDIVAAGFAEIGRIAPRRFQEDIDLVADALEYDLLQADWPGITVPEIEVTRVELWDNTTSPARAFRRLAPMSGEYVNFSEAGWSVRDGTLELPSWFPVALAGDEANYTLRVWGYAPYVVPTADGTTIPLSTEREQALRAYARVEGINRLLASRDLFTQWQTRSGNTDVSPAALMNNLSLAEQSWNKKARAIAVLRGG